MKRIIVATVALAGGLGVSWMTTDREADAFAGETFEITGGGRQYHFEGQPLPGKKAFVNKISAGNVVGCITGADPSCAAFVEQDAGGKAYLFMDTQTSWRVSTALDGSNATTLTGLVDGSGAFMFAGTHVKSGSQVLLTGKVRFQKGTYTPQAVVGKVNGVSTLTRHFVYGTFKSVGGPKRR
jgi:hypothetical protein